MPDWDLVKRRCTLSACAFIGALTALLADLIQKETSSATLRVSSIAHAHLGLNLAPLYWILFLVALGLGICFVKNPQSREGSFYAAASVVALLMTVVPVKSDLVQPRSPAPTATWAPYGSPTIVLTGGPGVTPVQFPWGSRGPDLGNDTFPFRKIAIKLLTSSGDFENAKAKLKGEIPLAEVTVLREMSDGRIIQKLTKTTALQSGAAEVGFLSVDTGPGVTILRIAVQAPGFEILTSTRQLLGSEGRFAPVAESFQMVPSDSPLWLQRVFKKPSERTF